MALGWRVVNLPSGSPNVYFSGLDDVLTPPGSVSEPFWVLSPGRRKCASMAYWERKAVVEVTYDLGDVLQSVEQKYEPVYGLLREDGMGGWEGVGTPNPPTLYELHEISAGTVALDLEPEAGGGPGSLNDLAVVMLAPEGT